MQLQIIAFGRWKAGPERALFEQYIARSPWSIELRELNVLHAAQVAGQQKKETAALLLAAQDFRAEKKIFLDETGKDLASPVLAEKFGQWRDGGDRRIALMIGGDVGLEKSRLGEADLTLSLGRMTWPHLLVRTLLAEQLYRAQTILSGHPYHRG